MPSEIVLVAAPPGGGKTTFIEALVRDGYVRANRDEVGGTLKTDGGAVYDVVRDGYARGERRFVMDNVYATIDSRAPAISLGKALGLPVRCLWLDTTAEQAQFLAALRQVRRYGKLFSVADYKAHRDDPNMFPPAAQFAYWKRVEPATVAEGFVAVEHAPIKIELGAAYVNKAVIFDYDGTLRETKSGRIYPTDPGDIQILPGRREKLAALKAQGYLLLGASNQSGISKKPGDPKYVSDADARRCFEATNRMLGQEIDFLYAPDAAGAPQTYWRKPLTGMAVLHIERHKLDPASCFYVGDLTTDQTFARRAGFRFVWAHEFFV
jgi:HAD superfamily hydrolase (TIGR01662 family)